MESFEEAPTTPAPVTTDDGFAPALPSVPPVSPSPNVYESPFEPASPVAGFPSTKPEQADFQVPAGKETGPLPPDLVPTSEGEPQPLPKNAYLVLQGTRVIPLTSP